MRQFFETYRDDKKVAPRVRQLPWTHHLILLGRTKHPEEREFYLLAAVQARVGSAVSSVAVSADGQLLATGSSDGTARVWNSRSGDALSPRLRHAANVHTVAFSTDARRLVTMTVDGDLRLYALMKSPDDTQVLQDRLEVEAGSTITRDGRSQLLQPDALLERWQRVKTANHGASGPNSARQPIQSVSEP